MKNINVMEIKEAISRLQTLLDTEISLNTKQAIAIGIEELKNSEDKKSNKNLFAAFDSGYKACLKEVLDWLKANADDYTWYNEMVCESGMTDDFYQDLVHYLNHKLEINDL